MVAKSPAGRTNGDPPDLVLDGVEGIDEAVPVGQGGAGTVYRAVQPRLRRTIAVKVMHDAVTDDGVRRRFEQECEVSGLLSAHPAIVDVYGAGFTNAQRPYILMEFVERGSLADRVEREGPLPWNETVDIIVKVTGALETAHRAGILHRDLKPENLLWSDFDEPLLSDFGIAGLQDDPGTSDQSWTIAHAAPELLTGGSPSAQSDLYAVGSTMFAMLCGQHAFLRDHDRTLDPVIHRIVHDPVPDLRNAGVPDALCTVMEQCMAKSPAHRFHSAEELGRQLQGLQRSWNLPMSPLVLRGQKREAVPVVAQQTGADTASAPAPEPDITPPAGRGNLARQILYGTAIGVVALFLLLYLTNGSGS